jgi:hypothetical protein
LRLGLPTCLVILLSLSLPWAFGRAADPPESDPDTSSSLVVTARQGLVSVKAQDAPLRDVVERIGKALNISVTGQTGADERVSTEFKDLPLEEALKRLGANYAYISDANSGGTGRIVLFPRGEAVAPVAPEVQPPTEPGQEPPTDEEAPVEEEPPVEEDPEASAAETGDEPTDAESFQFDLDPSAQEEMGDQDH